mmetsp:Transcript_27332/g.20470  ORF Transcript_27332/g.20470 Transcript_27332/m.20470 type:complete len:109 (+) Transcript_27332:247-573(+)
MYPPMQSPAMSGNSLVINPHYKINSRYPVMAHCVACGTTAMTSVQLEHGKLSMFTSIFLFFCCLIFVFPCCCLGFFPLAFNEVKDSLHYCATCKMLLARVERHHFNQS